MLVAVLIAIVVGAWWLRGRSGRAADPGAIDDAAGAHALAACDAILRAGPAAYRELHVHRGDVSVSGDHQWVPFPGASMDDFAGWEARVDAAFEAARQWLDNDAADDGALRCAEVVAVELSQPPSALEREQQRVLGVRVRVAGGRERMLVLGPSVMTGRGRRFHGEADGVFAQFEGQPDAPATAEAGTEPAPMELPVDPVDAPAAGEQTTTLARRTNPFPETGPEDTEALELVLELVDGALVARWSAHFGDRLFGNQYAPHLLVSLTGGPERVEKRFDVQPGINTGSAELLSAAPPGEYAASLFLWSQRPDGTQVSDNAASVFLELR